MATVYNTVEIVYSAKVCKSVLIPLYPRLRKSVEINFNILGIVQQTTEVMVPITDYLMVRNSVEVPIAARVFTSVQVPYTAEFTVRQSIEILVQPSNTVRQSVELMTPIPGYTMVRRSTRILCRFTDQTLIQPSIPVIVTF